MKTEIEAVTLFTYAITPRQMRRVEYESLPSRQSEDLRGLPVDGMNYRDPAHPSVLFTCRAGMDWSRYYYERWPLDIVA